MEAINENIELKAPVCQVYASNPPASIKSNRRCYLGVITFMVMLSVLLLAGLIILGLLYGDSVRHLSEISDKKDNLIEHLNAVIEGMNSSLTDTTKELMDCKQNGDSVRHLSEISDKKDSLIEHLNAVIEGMNSSLNDTTKELMDCKKNGDSVRHLSEISDKKDNLIEHLNAVIEGMNSSLIQTTKKLMDCKQNGDSVRQLSETSDKKDNLVEHLNAVTEGMNSSLIQTTKKLMDFKQRKKGCPEKWSRFGSSCYFLREESKSWDEAREICRAKEADLLVINSKEENEFISELKKQDVWLGLTDRDLEGTWKWVDGSPVTLQFWASKQPDNIGGVEDCAHTNFEFPGLWNDIPCRLYKQLICEKEEMLLV